jgi:hypothetical protein
LQRTSAHCRGSGFSMQVIPARTAPENVRLAMISGQSYAQFSFQATAISI